MATSLEHMTAEEIGEWLKSHGFSEDIVANFQDNDMDGDAVSLAFAAHSGPDCLKDVVPKYGLRLKVYQAIKAELEAARAMNNSLDSSGTGEENPVVSPASSVQVQADKVQSVSASEPSSSMKSTSTQKTPNPFPIPMFRVDTQMNLKDRKLGDDDRKYIVRVLATVLCTYVQRPSMRDCEIVAKSLVAKYAFLKEHESWKQFLYTKCQNLNRKQVNKKDDCDGSAKRRKIDKSNHEYPSTMVDVEDEVTHKRNYNALVKECSKVSPKSDILIDLMKRTFGRRRLWILESERLILSICEEYPPLKKASHIVQEFSMIIDKNDLFESFESSWPKWESAIIKYSAGTKNKTQGLYSALKGLKSCDSAAEEDNSDGTIVALRCLAYFLCKKEKNKSTLSREDTHVQYILRHVPRGTPDNEAIDCSNNFPHIVMFVDEDLEILPRYHIAVEQVLLVECRSLIQAIFCLLAVHYVFNVKYHSRAEDFFLFLLEKVLGVQDVAGNRKKKKSASYLSATSAIECYLDV